MATTSETKAKDVERLPGIARGGAFLIEPLGSRDIFITGEFTDEQLAYADTAEDFVTKEILPRLEAIEHKEEGLAPGCFPRTYGCFGIHVFEVNGRSGMGACRSHVR